MFGFILFGTLLTGLGCLFYQIGCLFYQIGMFSAIIFLNWFSVSSFGLPMILMLVCLVVFWRSLKLQFFTILIFISVGLIGWFPLTPSSLALFHQQICWFPLVSYWFQLVFSSDWFLYFLFIQVLNEFIFFSWVLRASL